jgi:hypothetical protein
MSDSPTSSNASPPSQDPQLEEPHWFETRVGDARLWGIISLISLVIAFSKRAGNSDGLVWIGLLLIGVFTTLIINTQRNVRGSQYRRLWTGVTFLVLAPILFISGRWLTTAIPPPVGFLQFDKVIVSEDSSEIQSGKKFGVHIVTKNPGPEKVFNTYWLSNPIIAENVDEFADHKVKAFFEKKLVPVRQQYLTGEITGGPEVGVGVSTYQTAFTGSFTQSQVDEIMSGRSRIYFVSWAAWTDSQDHKKWAYDCRWLQSYREAPYEIGRAVWHVCQN